jgi:hypothetical protein
MHVHSHLSFAVRNSKIIRSIHDCQSLRQAIENGHETLIGPSGTLDPKVPRVNGNDFPSLGDGSIDGQCQSSASRNVQSLPVPF